LVGARYVAWMPQAELVLRSRTRPYQAFNARDVEAAVALMHPDRSITVDVHQVVHHARTGDLISDSQVRHRYRLVDGLVVRIDVLEAPDTR
jgi:hypothetical protein